MWDGTGIAAQADRAGGQCGLYPSRWHMGRGDEYLHPGRGSVQLFHWRILLAGSD